ncbi:MAG TPA: hypothetical protein VIF37_20590 [Methylobacter sp.]|jgi:hypothetical protein
MKKPIIIATIILIFPFYLVSCAEAPPTTSYVQRYWDNRAKEEAYQLAHPKPISVSMIVNTMHPDVTQASYDQANLECDYQVASTTADLSWIPPNSRLSRSTEEASHQVQVRIKQTELKDLCIASKGYKFISSTDKKDIEIVKKQCPGYEMSGKFCVIPNIIK